MLPRFLYPFLGLPLILWCQKPELFPGGVANAASYTTANNTSDTVGKGVSGGSIVSIFGTNLAASAVTASVVPLPTQLGGTSVTVGCIAAHLFHVSPGQINLQMPSPNGGGACVAPGSSGIVVSTAAGSSDPYLLDRIGAEGIFTRDMSGCGQGSVLNVKGDGAVSHQLPLEQRLAW